MVTNLTWSDDLGKRVRTGDWADQIIPTVDKIEEAVREGEAEAAAQLIDYFMEEAKVVFSIYKIWSEGFEGWLRERGVGEKELDAEVRRLAWLLRLPDGSLFLPFTMWEELGERAGRLGNLVRSGEIGEREAVSDMDGLREGWRMLHDRWVDYLSGILAFAAGRFGEASLEDMYRRTLEPYIQERYMPFDLRERDYADTIFRNLYTAVEAMRAHLCGPERRGDMDFDEYEDRWVISFDPCGSGGRSSRGDPEEGTGSRVLPPYRFGVTQEEHDWAWNEKGVCYYCAHCCFALERLPAERWGHPVRVVDSPLYPDETSGPEPKKCTWTVYKTVEAIPEEAYRRIGLTKPGSKDEGPGPGPG